MIASGILLVPVVAMLLFILPSFLYFRFSRRPRIAVPAGAFAAIHAALVVALALFIASVRDESGDPAEMAWLLFYVVDMPVSVLLYPLTALTAGAGYAVHNYWLPLIFFATFGSAQYFAVAAGVAWLVKRLVGRPSNPPGTGEQSGGSAPSA